MFSQFRHAVENLAAPVRSSLDENNGNNPDEHRDVNSISRSNSVDSQPRSSTSMSSSQLADSALSNLRKSLNSPRPASPGNSPSPRSASGARTRTTLEDRLRAAAIARSPSGSSITSPSPPPSIVVKRAIAPHDVPLPDSPAQSPRVEPVHIPNEVEDLPLDASKAVSAGKAQEAAGSPEELDAKTQPGAVEPTNDESGLKFSKETEAQQSAVASPSEESQPPSEIVDNRIMQANTRGNDLDLEDVDGQKEVVETIQEEVSETPARAESVSLPPTDAASEESPTEESPKHEAIEVIEESHQSTDLEEIQERLRQIEQRFLDVSTSYKQLQSEKAAADLVVKEFTPLGSIEDSDALRDYLHDISSKAQAFQVEIKDLNTRLQVQETRMEDLRDTHKLESASQSEHVSRLKTQLEESEALIAASQKADTQAEEKLANKQAELEQVQKDLAKAQTTAKEEEEKRVKAISLLKTVRQKLVKAEKDKEDGVNELKQLREKLQGDKEKDQAAQLKYETELNTKLQAKNETINGLRSQHEKELATLKERHDRELAAVKGQADLEWSALKATHDQEMAMKTATIQSLESALQSTRDEKNNLFDTFQIRQAELESAQSHLEVLQSQNTELRYQLREAEEKADVLKEDLGDLQREHQARMHDSTPSANEVALLISATEAKYENKIQELKRSFANLERERDETDAEWSRKLDEKVRENEELKKLAGSAATLTEQYNETVSRLEDEIVKLRGDGRLLQQQLADLQQSNLAAQEVEKKWKYQAQEWDDKVAGLEQQLEEAKQRENQLRAGNKTLREEMKKVQSSVAVLERQRAPGMGLWASRSTDANGQATPASAGTPVESPRPQSPAPDAPKRITDDQEVNLEYLRNVIFQFLEHKEMRPNLVRVLSTILHFTPQETRRLIAKV